MHTGLAEADLRPVIAPVITPSSISMQDQIFSLASTKIVNGTYQPHTFYRSTSIHSSGLQIAVNSFNPITHSMNVFSEHLDCIISEDSKLRIADIIVRVSELSDVEKLLLYLRLPSGQRVPLEQHLYVLALFSLSLYIHIFTCSAKFNIRQTHD